MFYFLILMYKTLVTRFLFTRLSGSIDIERMRNAYVYSYYIVVPTHTVMKS